MSRILKIFVSYHKEACQAWARLVFRLTLLCLNLIPFGEKILLQVENRRDYWSRMTKQSIMTLSYLSIVLTPKILFAT
jgi:hypothetical protein